MTPKIVKIIGVVILVGLLVVAGKIISRGDRNQIAPDPAEKLSNQQVFTISNHFPDLSYSSHVEDDIQPNISWVATGGAIVKYDHNTQKIQKIFDGTSGVTEVPGAIIKKGKYIYYGFEGGIKRVDANTGQIKTFKTEDGLVNGSNILFSDDPHTNDLWVSTFGGLSRFDTVDETFENFTVAMTTAYGCTTWGVFPAAKVSEKYVWVQITANAYCQGGIARYDKAAKNWDSWGPTAFGLSDRVDFNFFSFATNGDRAFVSRGESEKPIDSVVYAYDSKVNIWGKLVDVKNGVRNAVFHNNRLYFVNYYDGLKIKYYDFADGKIKPSIDPVNTSGSEPALLVDEKEDRVVIGPKAINFVENEFPNVSTILARFDDLVLMKGDEGLYSYNLNSGKISGFLSEEIGIYDSVLVKQIGNQFAIIRLPQCDMVCGDDGELFVLSQSNFQIEKRIIIPVDYRSVKIGKEWSEVFLISSQDNSVKRYDYQSNRLIDWNDSPSRLEALEQLDNTARQWSNPSGHAAHQSFTNTLEAELTINDANVFKERKIQFKSSPYSPWGTIYIILNGVVEDSLNKKIIWITSNSGLIRYDIGTDQYRHYGVEDGLASNYTYGLVANGKQLIAEHDTGIYIYQINP